MHAAVQGVPPSPLRWARGEAGSRTGSSCHEDPVLLSTHIIPCDGGTGTGAFPVGWLLLFDALSAFLSVPVRLAYRSLTSLRPIADLVGREGRCALARTKTRIPVVPPSRASDTVRAVSRQNSRVCRHITSRLNLSPGKAGGRMLTGREPRMNSAQTRGHTFHPPAF